MLDIFHMGQQGTFIMSFVLFLGGGGGGAGKCINGVFIKTAAGLELSEDDNEKRFSLNNHQQAAECLGEHRKSPVSEAHLTVQSSSSSNGRPGKKHLNNCISIVA